MNKQEKICTGCGRLSSTPMGLNANGEKYLACCPDNNYVEVSTMSNKKQTAVEWLEYQLDQYGKTHFFSKRELIAKAKEMEKEQIRQTYFDSTSQFSNEAYMPYVKPFEQYYKETYEQ